MKIKNFKIVLLCALFISPFASSEELECKKNRDAFIAQHAPAAIEACKKQVKTDREYKWTQARPFYYDDAMHPRECTFKLFGEALLIKDDFGAWDRKHYSCTYTPDTKEAYLSVGK